MTIDKPRLLMFSLSEHKHLIVLTLENSPSKKKSDKESRAGCVRHILLLDIYILNFVCLR